MTVSPAAREFIRQRSKAMGDHFMEFVRDRGLDIDMDSWHPADRAEFEQQSRILIDRWRAAAAEVRHTET